MPELTGEALCTWLVDDGVLDELPVDYSQFDVAVSAAVRSLERDSGFTPFIADEIDQTHQYESRGTTVNLKGGYTSITSVSINGTVLTEDTQYRKMPLDGDRTTYLDIAWAPDDVVTVVGKRGYANDFPDDVYFALLCKAAIVATVNSGKINGQLAEIRQGEVAIKFNVNASQHKVWQEVYDAVLKHIKRPRVF